ncbi:hypothetical protein GGS24DRAFT_457554 [Hypoxylon argillaceum]|nr:hypothetical protein GGS24DRAFT_457554 [Hypoxylon argillaceum]
MEQSPAQIQSELESFRRQWQEEVSSRARNPAAAQSSTLAPASASTLSTAQQQQQLQHRPANRGGSSSTSNRPHRRHEPPAHTKGPTSIGKIGQLDDDDDYVPAPVFDGDGASSSSAAKAKGAHTLDGEGAEGSKEPKTALDFYEHAVERESTGKLGDSLQLYRKAFRMDDKVDRQYRDKHFAGRWTKPAQQQQINPSNAAVTVPNTAHHSLEGSGSGSGSGNGGSGDPVVPLSFPELIASFAGLKVEGSPPECEGVEPPPCPIAALPDEILVHVLRDVATADVGDFVRLSQVCKRLAYLVATEDQIWRRVCVGPEFGFAGMHHHFQQTIAWEPLTLSDALVESDSEADSADADIYTLESLRRRQEAEAHATTLALYPSVAGYASWQAMFRRRPRVRFNGCYISTVNYIRPGQNSGQHLTWNTPVHIVTYYRYLRLFRDGTAISLTTTDEPANVVHHLTRDALSSHRSKASHQHGHQHLPSSVMALALKGRWRLSSPRDQDRSMNGDESNLPPQLITPKPASSSTTTTANALSESEGDLYVETEGTIGTVGSKYTYRLDLSLRSAGRSASSRNNKLVWRGFWSYNRLTDDWAQFTLKNDKPFFFSRVKSYGVGE